MHASELSRFLVLPLAGTALLLGGYAAFGRAHTPAPAPPACSCDDSALRRDVETLSRRVDAVTSLAFAPRGAKAAAPEPSPADAATVRAAAPSAPLVERVETVEVGDGGLVLQMRMPDGTIVTTHSAPTSP